MNHWLIFAAGVFVGFIGGYVICCLMVTASRGEGDY